MAAVGKSLVQTALPNGNRENIKYGLLKNLPCAQYDKNLFAPLQKQIIAYFEERAVDFNRNLSFSLEQFTDFTKEVLTACKSLPPGQTISYGRLAKMVNSPKAARAVGTALAKNPMPLVIPCHRVVKCNGCPGEFSATGGKKLKQKLIAHEQKIYKERQDKNGGKD
ncbi:MAG: methylated-DNA--[protein]-cysteine S-methyltransferase [Planctomycetes bacterium]|nr:methylated-DNA--[protein]-cysteine S-methyltransferase [Planctomycetota bacterium]